MRRLVDLGLEREGALVLGPRPDPAAEVTGLSVDSRLTRPGHLFAGLKGARMDGAAFIPYAQRMGATAALATLDGALRAREAMGGLPIPVFTHPDPRRLLALAAARFHASQPGAVVAVTGTAGKTSTASFARQLWAARGRRAVNFGTAGVEGAAT
ncbi:MAG: Mur ligase domain-containing protein, partial [Rubrimonas sp.]